MFHNSLVSFTKRRIISVKIEKLKLFIDLYETGSYTKTANQNYISQTSVTQFINSLEAEMGVKLFDRTTIPVKATVEGDICYRESKKLLSQYETMITKVKAGNQQLRFLRIFFTSRVDMQFLIPALRKFRETYPDIRLIFQKVSFRNAFTSLRNGDCDIVLGIDFDGKSDEHISLETVYQGQYVALIPQTHELYAFEQVSNEELYHYPLIMLSQDSIGDSLEAMIKKSNIDGFYPNIAKTVDDIDTEFLCIVTDNLIGFAPDNYSLNEFEGLIKKVPLKQSSHSFELIMAHANSVSPEIQLFMNMLKQSL